MGITTTDKELHRIAVALEGIFKELKKLNVNSSLYFMKATKTNKVEPDVDNEDAVN